MKENELINVNELEQNKVKQWEEVDRLYCNELDDKIFIERTFYRSLIIINFKENLKILDGITITSDEINKSTKRIKKLKNILQKSLIDVNKIDDDKLTNNSLINKNNNLTNLLSKIDINDKFNKLNNLNKSINIF